MFRTLLITTLLLSLSAISIVGAASVVPQTASPRAYVTAPVDLRDIKLGSFFGRMDLDTGKYTAIGKTPFLIGIAQSGGRIYGVDADSNLVRIDPANAATTVIGSTGVTSPPGPFGLAVDVFSSLSNGKLFLMDYQNNLFSVDAATGRATLIGSTKIPPLKHFFLATSLAGDSNALYFTVHEVSRKNLSVIRPPTLYRIDPSTARATRVGATADFVFGAVFTKNTLYGFTRTENLSRGNGNLIIALNTRATKQRQSYRVVSSFVDVIGSHGIMSATVAQ